MIAGILAFFFQRQRTIEINLYLLLLPAIPFFFLDSYYLGLEKYFRGKYNYLLINGSDDETIEGSKWYQELFGTLRAMLSFSVWGFYLVLGLVTYFILASAKFD
jgi:hypothetical protein